MARAVRTGAAGEAPQWRPGRDRGSMRRARRAGARRVHRLADTSEAGIVGLAFEMEDERIHNRIEQLVAEEHELYERSAEGGLNENEHRRLESLKVGLDQCWDLLRQRRALREAGDDPAAARVRDPEVVERYEQ